MAGDELFKRYLEIGASVLGMTRERAESIVKDLVASGEVAKGQAGKAADWLVERGRTGTEEVAELVRREIRQQITALGLATKDDVARLEARIDQLEVAAKPAPRPRKAKATAGAAPPDAGVAGTKSAGISRSGSVRKRPAAAPPAGGADPSKG
jgi:polyhydroxyalkanoate synthesis regulator phasin